MGPPFPIKNKKHNGAESLLQGIPKTDICKLFPYWADLDFRDDSAGKRDNCGDDSGAVDHTVDDVTIPKQVEEEVPFAPGGLDISIPCAYEA
jgi:hypothetical protein